MGYVVGYVVGHVVPPTNTPTGTLYRIDPNTPSSFTVLHNFTLADGEINVEDNATAESWRMYPSGVRYAAGMSGDATVRSLLAGGAQARAADRGGVTALHLAAKRGDAQRSAARREGHGEARGDRRGAKGNGEARRCSAQND